MKVNGVEYKKTMSKHLHIYGYKRKKIYMAGAHMHSQKKTCQVFSVNMRADSLLLRRRGSSQR